MQKPKHGTCDDPFLYFEILLNSNLLQSQVSKCNRTRNPLKFQCGGKKYLLNRQIYTRIGINNLMESNSS